MAGLALAGAPAARAQLAIDTSNPTDWRISNGTVFLDWKYQARNIWKITLAGRPDNLIDVANTNSNGQPKGLYMDNAGVGSGPTTAGYHADQGYLDWWLTTASATGNPFTYTQHFILFPNDPGLHVYSVFSHAPTDPTGSLGQVQYVFRVNPALFTNTYSVNSGLHNLGPTSIPEPSPAVMGNADPGRQVQDATLDVHGLSLPAGFNREFEVKYDYAGYEYLQEANGVYGDTYGAWAVFPSLESLVGGPSKQNLLFTGSILMGELLSDHLAYNVGFTSAKGQAASRLFGPVYFHLNAGLPPAAMYQEALDSVQSVYSAYDREAILVASGYVPSTARGSVQPVITGGGSTVTDSAWTVLGDNQVNFQFTNKGAQYWVADDATGMVPLTGVIPGTYRLSAYVLGQWGEARMDNVVVAPNAATRVALPFLPENFSTAQPIWTIGTPDRSAHEFRHAADASGQDDKEYWGNWNYWSDFAANRGAAIYYATAVGGTPATNDLSQWNYIQWHSFDPGLYAGIYNSADDSTDGYRYIVPSYVGNPATATVPPWQVHFTTTALQQAQGPYVVLSVGLAATNSDLTVSLNGNSLTWRGYSTLKTSDAQVRSGISGTYQWVVFQWPLSALQAPGGDNLLTFAVNQSQGVMYDALRMEIAATSAAPSAHAWYDYEFVTAGSYVPADDTKSNP